MSNDIFHKLEEALVAMVIAEQLTISVSGETITLDATRVYAGFSRGRHYAQQPQDQTLPSRIILPCIQCIARSAGQSRPLMPGNRIIDCEINLRANASDTYEEDFRDTYFAMSDLFMTSNIQYAISQSASNLGVLTVYNYEQGYEMVDDSYVARVGFTTECIARALDDQPS